MCDVYTTVADRRSRAALHHGEPVCAKCLCVHKGSQTCIPCQERTCTDKGSHGILACPKRLAKVSPSQSSTKITTNQSPDNMVHNISHVKTTRSVALPTATLLVRSDDIKDASVKTVGVLFDTAAQQTIVHKAFVQKLQIKPIRKEWATLQGFGNHKSAPIPTHGVHLIETFWGLAIVGKIIGSTKLADTKSVNHVSIINVACNSEIPSQTKQSFNGRR